MLSASQISHDEPAQPRSTSGPTASGFKKIDLERKKHYGNRRNILKDISELVFEYFDEERCSSLFPQYLDSQVQVSKGHLE